MVEIYLGNSLAHIKQWIINHTKKDAGPLCFTGLESNSTVSMYDTNGAEIKDILGTYIFLSYSTDGMQTWTDYDGSEIVLSDCTDNKVYIRATEGKENSGFTDYEQDFGVCFKIDAGKVAASGNIQYLLTSDGSKTDVAVQCYAGMFSDCTSLTTAPELPATTLAESCYSGMFHGCTSLTTAPKLPATTLADDCYCNMFFDCTSLTTAPELPATTLADDCYCNMFSDCTSLTTAPELPATTLASWCYTGMFSDCTSLTTAPELPATTLASWCYAGMFSDCTSLTTAPELPATTLAEKCYEHMLNGTSSELTSVNMAKVVEGTYNTETHGELKSGLTINYTL